MTYPSAMPGGPAVVVLPHIGPCAAEYVSMFATWCEVHDRGGNGRAWNGWMRHRSAKTLSKIAGRHISPSQTLEIMRAAYSHCCKTSN